MKSEDSVVKQCFRRLYGELGNDVAAATSEFIRGMGRNLTAEHDDGVEKLGHDAAALAINIIIDELGAQSVYIPSYRDEILAARNKQIVNLSLKGNNVEHLAEVFRLSQRQIQRILKGAK